MSCVPEWIPYVKKLRVVWEENGEGRTMIYDVTSCYPDMAIPDGQLVVHVQSSGATATRGNRVAQCPLPAAHAPETNSEELK